MTRSERALAGAGIGFALILSAVVSAAAGTLHPVSLSPDTVGEGVGRTAAAEMIPAGVSEAPADWFRPEEAAVVWTADETCAHTPDGIAAGGIDWNLESPSLTGWDGRTMTPIELEVLTRVMSREFCGCSLPCIDAGFDSIMRRWECGYWGRTIFEVLSAVEDNGRNAYTTFPHIWEGVIEEYDWFREYCLGRFRTGPEWSEDVMYFNLGGYPGWAVPYYEMDGVYFSASPYLAGWHE